MAATRILAVKFELKSTPELIGAEIERRLNATRVSNPNQKRDTDLRHRMIRVRKSIDRLVNAYQKELISIDELYNRMPEPRRQERALDHELQSLIEQVSDRQTDLQLAETLEGFLTRMRLVDETLDVAERQRIVRLLVKEVLVGEDKITIRHSIRVSESPSGGSSVPPRLNENGVESENYLLCTGCEDSSLRYTGPVTDNSCRVLVVALTAWSPNHSIWKSWLPRQEPVP